MEATAITYSPEDLEVIEQDLRLIEESKSWTPNEWEIYLSNMDIPMTEVQLSSSKYDLLAENAEFDAFVFAQSDASPHIVERVRLALESLTIRQRQVVELIYFKAKSSREAAVELSLSQSSVRDLLRKAIKNLRRNLVGGTLNFPYVEGQFETTEQL